METHILETLVPSVCDTSHASISYIASQSWAIKVSGATTIKKEWENTQQKWRPFAKKRTTSHSYGIWVAVMV